MVLYKILIINIYKFLVFLNGKTIYKDSKEAKLHTYLTITLLNTMNVFTIITFLYFEIEGKPYKGLILYLIPVVFFIINYYLLYKKQVFNSIFSSKLISFDIIHIAITIIYVSATIYFMILTGNLINAFTTG